ncbi:MAG TPA: hypothetical protein VL361_29700 [Candidatus Limnocylindrales bacterium]|nr:hypothetical protein [Candidatus Limnocylindrales bacterium]
MRVTHLLNAASLLGLAFSSLAQPLPITTTPPKTVAQAFFSADGKLIVTNTDKTVRIWDAQTSKPLAHIGTWRLASFKYGDTNQWSEVPNDQKRIKLITPTHFTWVAYEAATGKVLSTAGGRYTLRGSNYVETIEYTGEGMSDYLGKQQSFTIKVETDTLRQSGQLSDGLKIDEVWNRMK